jgi:hypothetical protein
MARMTRWLGYAVDRGKTQNCKRQEGRDGGVHTHDDFGGAERQSISYTNALVRGRVSDQVGSVYLSINSELNPGLSPNLFLLIGPDLQLGRSLQMVLHQGVKQSASRDRGERLVNSSWGLLIRKFNDVAGAGVELSAMTGGLIIVGPGGRRGPDLSGSP